MNPVDVSVSGIEVTAGFLTRLLDVIEFEIIPLTRVGVSAGNKIFGAALLRKQDASTILASTNNETENPLWHGEIHAIKQYYERANADESFRHPPQQTVFLATHEPCTLCASAIAWGGYDNVFYLFSHEDSRDSFQIGHDLQILEAVFGLAPGAYARSNRYWTALSIPALVAGAAPGERHELEVRMQRIRQEYAELSAIYQKQKGRHPNIPLP